MDVIRVGGSPERRGRDYGRTARSQIHEAITGYAGVFEHYAGWSWSVVQRRANRFLRPIEEFSEDSYRELRAIADGAGVEVADIMALNVRSEIMFSAPGRGGDLTAAECTSFAVLAERTSDGRMLMGQNWDWIEQARSTSVLLEVRRDDGPDFATVVEAGMLAKVGVNSAGVGLCTNTLISDGDEGRVAVPYHALLRAVLDSPSGAEAAARVQAASRANSANYLIGDATGFCVDLETTPGEGPCGVLEPADGVLTHANHFLVAGLTEVDRYRERKANTGPRFDNLTGRLAQVREHSVESLAAALADHQDAPGSVCQHPDPRQPDAERSCTVAGIVIDVQEKTLHFCAGSPCEAQWSTHALGRPDVDPR